MAKLGQNKWFIYVDYTTENQPRPFYVGKGILNRVLNRSRNTRHKNVSNKFGFNRVIVFSSFDEDFAYQIEEQLVDELHTFIGDIFADKSIASNLSRGGRGGMTGNIQTDKTKELHRLAALGKKHTNEAKIKIRNARALQDNSVFVGKKHSDEAKIKIKLARANQKNIPMKGCQHSEETKEKIRQSMLEYRRSFKNSTIQQNAEKKDSY